MQNLSYENEFQLHENEPEGGTYFHEFSRTNIRFETEAKGNSEMAYYLVMYTVIDFIVPINTAQLAHN